MSFTVSFIMPRFMESECLEVMRPAEMRDGERAFRGKITYKKQYVDLYRNGNKFNGCILAMKEFDSKEEAEAYKAKVSKVEGIDEIQINEK
ncbi:hypothetical protein SM033_00100 [Vibrio phage vB_VpaM_sm033]|nr:hypothetical protein SM033_00100 [Vibrio phage vB_VpaM_sm033]